MSDDATEITVMDGHMAGRVITVHDGAEVIHSPAPLEWPQPQPIPRTWWQRLLRRPVLYTTPEPPTVRVVKWRINRATREAWTVPSAGLGDTQHDR
jgi:hypothetical protein